MGDKSPKSKKREQSQKNAAKKGVADQAQAKRDRQNATTALPPKGKK